MAKLFTDDDKIIAKHIEGYEYITRDDDGQLAIHSEKPKKCMGLWLSHGATTMLPVDCFESVLWIDDEPALIRDIVEGA